jgi:hypothetical protein
MSQGAYERAYARRAAGLALAQSETPLGQAQPDDGDPTWIDFFTHARLAADATEIHRDLQMPHMVMRFEEMATMPALTYTRSAGMRNAIVGSAHLQARRLDEGLQHGHRAVDILSRVASTRSLTDVKRPPPRPGRPGGRNQRAPVPPPRTPQAPHPRIKPHARKHAQLPDGSPTGAGRWGAACGHDAGRGFHSKRTSMPAP